MSIKKSISFTFGAQIINTLITFISSIIITRILGAEGRGENAIFTNATSFAVLFFGFSINSTIPYFINSGKAKAEELLTTIIIFSLGSAVLVFGTLSLLENFGKLNLVLSGSIQSVQYKLIFTGIYICSLLSGILSTYLLTFKKFKEVSMYMVIFQVLPLSIYLLLYFNILPYNRNNPFSSIVNITAIVSLLSVISILLLFLKIVPIRPSKKVIPGGLIKHFLFFSSMAYVGNVATFLNYKLDFWVVDAYCGKSQLGIYSLAAQLSQLLWILPSAISSVLYSYASRCNETEAIQYTIRLKKIAFYSTILIAIFGLLSSYFFIPILYGREFTESFNLMMIFIIGVIPFSIPIVNASLFAARGNFRTSFVISVVIFVMSSIIYFILIPRWGLVGGAIASAMVYLIASIMSEIWFCKTYNISYMNIAQVNKKILSINALIKLLKR